MKILGRKQIGRLSGAVVTAFLAITAPLFAQEKAEPEPAKEPGHGCVWKLSDGDNTVYLAGSVHLLREKDFPLPVSYDLAYADSSRVVFEIDMADLTSKEGGMEMVRAGSYPADDSLKKHVTEETFGRIVDYFSSRNENPTAAGMSAPILERLKPGMIFLMISAVEAQELGARSDLGLENQIFEKAVRDDKPTAGLETIAYQMSRFDQFTPEEIEDLIIQTLDELEKMPEVIDKLITTWHKGNVRALNKLLNEQMEEEDPAREVLLTERNENWIPKIEEALEGSENVMFLVGAAHLVGKSSVIDLLRKKGYEIKRVRPGKVELKKAA